MREKELIELEQHVRALEQTNLEINEKLNVAHLTDATTFTYYKYFFCVINSNNFFSISIEIHF